MSYDKRFLQYVWKNISGEIGVSFYLLVDTYFISVSDGPLGIAALNLVLPVYGLIYAIGAMIGRGSAIQFSLQKKNTEINVSKFFFNAISFCIIFGCPFSLIGFIKPDLVLQLMGGNGEIIGTGLRYTKIFMSFAPFFMLNFAFNAFVRNDGSPSLAMAAVLLSSFLNIVGDYIFMFPLKMGMAGAALATSLSPIIGILVCCIHFFQDKNTITFKWYSLEIKVLIESCKLGFSSFVSQMANGTITFIYNMVLLNIAGNIAVAAYGIIANIALVLNSLYTGLATGIQPLISEYYADKKSKLVNDTLKLSNRMSIMISFAILGALFFNISPIVHFFNNENNLLLKKYAETGLLIYAAGFIFSGLNMIGTEFFSSVGYTRPSVIASSMRGFILISICTILFSKVFGIIGVWLSYPVTELLVLLYIICNERKFISVYIE